MVKTANIIPESKILHETLFTEFKGKSFLPDVLNQNNYFPAGSREDGQCGSLSAAEVMQAKKNLRSMKLNEETPPMLSVQQLVDAHTPKPADYLKSVFRYLENEGLVCDEDYKTAPSADGDTRLKNVEGLTKHKIISSTNCYCGRNNLLRRNKRRRAINDFTAFGPLMGDLVVTHELLKYKEGIIQGENYVHNETTGRVLAHAATIIGFGITTNHIMYWVMRNNWGKDFGKNGIFRITMDLVPNVYSAQVHVNETEVDPHNPNNQEPGNLEEPVLVFKSPRRSARRFACRS